MNYKKWVISYIGPDRSIGYDTEVSSRFSLLTMSVCSIASYLQLVCFIHELGADTVMGKTGI